jgi:hypothetical protein
MHLTPVVTFSSDYSYSCGQKVCKYPSCKRSPADPQLIERLSGRKLNSRKRSNKLESLQIYLQQKKPCYSERSILADFLAAQVGQMKDLQIPDPALHLSQYHIRCLSLSVQLLIHKPELRYLLFNTLDRLLQQSMNEPHTHCLRRALQLIRFPMPLLSIHSF